MKESKERVAGPRNKPADGRPAASMIIAFVSISVRNLEADLLRVNKSIKSK